jgi:hypothetical protein
LVAAGTFWERKTRFGLNVGGLKVQQSRRFDKFSLDGQTVERLMRWRRSARLTRDVMSDHYWRARAISRVVLSV